MAYYMQNGVGFNTFSRYHNFSHSIVMSTFCHSYVDSILSVCKSGTGTLFRKGICSLGVSCTKLGKAFSSFSPGVATLNC